jgi:hypothetical protein
MEGMGEKEEEAPRGISEPEPEGGTQYEPSGLTMRDDSGLEDEVEYLWETHSPADSDEPEGERWWSPEPPEPDSEDDEEEICQPAEVPEFEHRGKSTPLAKATPRIEVGDLALPCVVRRGEPPGTPGKGESPHTKKVRRRKLRKKVTKDRDHEWETARQDAWLRELLTDSSRSESEEKYARFAESGTWIAEMIGVPEQAMTTSRGKCSGQEKPES